MNNSPNALNRTGFSAGFVGLLLTGGLLLNVVAYGETMEEKLKVQAEQEKELAAAEEKRQAEKDAKEAAAKATQKEKDRKAAAAEKKAQEETDRKAAARAQAKREAAAAKEAEAKANHLAEEQARPEPTPVVIAEPPASRPAASGSYTINGDGTVTDTKTGLMWKRCSEGQSGKDCSIGKAEEYNWDNAMAKFSKGGISFAGHSDWRMPTIEELRTLVYCSNDIPQEEAWESTCHGKDDKAGDYQSPALNQTAFPNAPSHDFWSSSPDAYFGFNAWLVAFNNGQNNWVNKGVNYNVRLVRSGQ